MRAAALSSGREQTGDRQTDSLWRKVGQIVQFLVQAPLMNGALLTEEDGAIKGSGLVFVAGITRSIPHRLGRKAVGFMEAYASGSPSAAHVGLFPAAPPQGTTSDTHVTVTPTASGTAYLWVF